jgi:hypothetical protein
MYVYIYIIYMYIYMWVLIIPPSFGIPPLVGMSKPPSGDDQIRFLEATSVPLMSQKKCHLHMEAS